MSTGTNIAEEGAVDITQRKRVEDALRMEKEKFRLLYEKVPLSYQSLDGSGSFIEVNQKWLDTLGYSRDEVIGRSFGDFIHSDWPDHFRGYFPRFKSMGEVLGAEFMMIKKDGSEALVQFDGKVSYDENGKFKQTHCLFKDITVERKNEIKT